MNQSKNYIAISLRCPVGVSVKDYYLSLINFLVKELKKYVAVNVID